MRPLPDGSGHADAAAAGAEQYLLARFRPAAVVDRIVKGHHHARRAGIAPFILDEASLKQIANVTQGEYFHAGTANDLRKVYESLSSKLVFEQRQSEVTALFAAAAALFAVLAAALSMLWFGRIM